MKRAYFSRFPQVFMSHHLRVRLRLVSKKAAWQVGEAHRASFPSRSPEVSLPCAFFVKDLREGLAAVLAAQGH